MARRDERGAWDRTSDEVASWFGDDDAARRRRARDERRDERRERTDTRERRDENRDYRRDERDTDRDESGLTRLDLLGRGYDHAAGGGIDRFAPSHERVPDDVDYPRRPRSGLSMAGPGDDLSPARRTAFDDPLEHRYEYGPQGNLYGQHTGYGPTIDRYTGRWESTLPDEERAQVTYRGRGPRNYRRSDERIREEIADRLTHDAWIDPTDVDVAVASGTVTLTGTVPDRQTKYRIEDLVEQTPGVGEVENRIRVQRATT